MRYAQVPRRQVGMVPASLAPVLFQPMAAEDVANAVVAVAVGPPINGVVEVAWRRTLGDCSPSASRGHRYIVIYIDSLIY